MSDMYDMYDMLTSATANSDRQIRMAGKRRQHPPQHQVTTRPVALVHRCRRRVWRCFVTGEERLIDPDRISLHAEATALVMGLHTFEIGVLGRGYPSRRNVGLIRAGYPRYGFIYPQHMCGMYWGSEVYADHRVIFPLSDYGDACPF